jgi:hypothetical protein
MRGQGPSIATLGSSPVGPSIASGDGFCHRFDVSPYCPCFVMAILKDDESDFVDGDDEFDFIGKVDT